VAKEKYTFEQFIETVDDEFKGFAEKINTSLLTQGYTSKIESKANGYFVSYSHQKSKRSLLNFLFRKGKLICRIYPENVERHHDIVHSLPDKMVEEINKAAKCKRFLNPEDCSDKCLGGYDFVIKDTNYKRCRYSCFQFLVTGESMVFIADMIGKEVECRRVA